VKTSASFVLILNKDGTCDVKRNSPEVLALCKAVGDDGLLAVLADLNLISEIKSAMETAPDGIGSEIMRMQCSLNESEILFTVYRLGENQLLVEISEQESSAELRLNFNRLLERRSSTFIMNTANGNPLIRIHPVDLGAES
jgi:hypothetical protein